MTQPIRALKSCLWTSAAVQSFMIICADDYGLRKGVDRAILELAQAKRLTAVSCMAVFSRCDEAAFGQLRALESALDLGLHLCLTHEDSLGADLPKTGFFAAGAPRFGNLLCRSMFARLNPQEVQAEVARQYELFVSKCGRAPDYIDGHLHVHQLPTIRQAVVSFARELPLARRPYIRNTLLPSRELRQRGLPWLKALFIGAFGQGLLHCLRSAGIRTNAGFSGIYDFKDWPRYPSFFPKFLDCLRDKNGILVVHPGQDEDWRQQEFQTLAAYPFQPGQLNRYL